MVETHDLQFGKVVELMISGGREFQGLWYGCWKILACTHKAFFLT